jgi:hypothetical protein
VGGRPNQLPVNELGAEPAAAALDLGCGTAADTVWLAWQG